MSTENSGQTRWAIDPGHTVVEFSVRHLMISRVKGNFTEVEGTIVGDSSNFTGGSVEATIVTSSIDTRDAKRDDHLRSGDFFESETYPNMTFKSTDVKKTGDDTYDVEGELTIRDKTLPVTLKTEFTGQATDPWGNTKIGFSAETTINRKEFGLGWNAPLEAGGVMVGDEVKISLEIQAAKTE